MPIRNCLGAFTFIALILIPRIMLGAPTWTKISANELTEFRGKGYIHRNLVSMNESAKDRLRPQPIYAQAIGDRLFFLAGDKLSDAPVELIVTDRRLNVLNRHWIKIPSDTAAGGWFVSEQAAFIVSHNWGGLISEPQTYKTFVTRYDFSTGKSMVSANMGQSLELQIRDLSSKDLLLTFGRVDDDGAYGRFVILRKDNLRTQASSNIAERPWSTIVSKNNFFGAGYIFPEFYNIKGTRILKDLEAMKQGSGSIFNTSSPDQFVFFDRKDLILMDANRETLEDRTHVGSGSYSSLVCALGESIYAGEVPFSDGSAFTMKRAFGSGPEAFEIPAVGKAFRSDMRFLACQGNRAAYSFYGKPNPVLLFELDSQNQLHQSSLAVDIHVDYMVWVSDDLLMFWRYESEDSEIGILDFKDDASLLNK